MKAITIRELHARTGQWLRRVARHGKIRVTDHGRIIAKILPEAEAEEIPYFARRKPSPGFLKLSESGKLSRGTDSTLMISEDREDSRS